MWPQLFDADAEYPPKVFVPTEIEARP